MSSSELLRVERLSSSWDGVPLLREVSFTVLEGEFRVLMGPNGSGKSTLLRCLAGLEKTDGGSVHLRGRPIDALPPHRRGIGMLFQDPALFEQRTVFENVAYGLELLRTPRTEIDRRVGELLKLLHLQGFEGRRATALSGGERQRVALARTLAPGPALVLLDEPFASVDAPLRAELMGEFREVLRTLHTAAIHVTHDREEGIFLGERVLVLMGGRLRRDGPPAEVFRDPRDSEVARFLGYNTLRRGETLLAVHPRALRLGAPSAGTLTARVSASGPTGVEWVVYLTTPDAARLEARLPLTEPMPLPGALVGVTWTDACTVTSADHVPGSRGDAEIVRDRPARSG